MASCAISGVTPSISNRILPGRITATHSSGAPLPLPIRVSAGFLVIGLSGNNRIQTLPPRLMKRVIAIRAASIWRDVIQPHDIAFRPYSPKAIDDPRHALPVMRPRCTLRYLTFLGINIYQFSLLPLIPIPLLPSGLSARRRARPRSGALAASFHDGCDGGISGGMIGPPARRGFGRAAPAPEPRFADRSRLLLHRRLLLRRRRRPDDRRRDHRHHDCHRRDYPATDPPRSGRGPRRSPRSPRGRSLRRGSPFSATVRLPFCRISPLYNQVFTPITP